VVSWALVSFGSASAGRAALEGSAALAAEHPGLTTRALSEVQVAHSTGAMVDVMRGHLEARGVAIREARAVADIAVACASPLCEVLSKPAAEVDAAEYFRASHVRTALRGHDVMA
jgi:hypothetical protein